jgi:insertion element IS1 protein InsB
VTDELKRKEKLLRKVNSELPVSMEISENTSVVISKADESEADEMRSFVESRANQRWLRHSADLRTGKILAHTFGKREDKVFVGLRKLPEPFGIRKFHTDGLGTYVRKADCECHEVGKRNTQKTERRHLTLRTRIKRLAGKTI